MHKELNVGKGINVKEDSDALIGQILTCAALLRANKLLSADEKDVTDCVKILVQASHHKIFHASMAYTFLVELLKDVSGCAVIYFCIFSNLIFFFLNIA